MSIVLEAGIAIYVALAVALAVWIGLFVYLWRLDAQARDLRRRLDNQPATETAAAPSATLRRQQHGGEMAATGAEPVTANPLQSEQ
jgi:CcmD family protein